MWSPRQPDTGGGGGGPAPARVRFPLGEEQVFFRATGNTYKEVCGAVVGFAGFNVLRRCWGLDTIVRCAAGSGPPEAATTWVARDTNLHMEVTVEQIERHLESSGRLGDIRLLEVTSEPWQQESLPELHSRS